MRSFYLFADVKLMSSHFCVRFFCVLDFRVLNFEIKMSKRKWAAIAILAFNQMEIDDKNDCGDDEEVKLKAKRIWVKNWLRQRPVNGFCATLLLQLRDEEPALYRNFVRMTTEQFNYLLDLVKPHIQKADTIMRKSISSSDRLVLTLRYLATGDNFSDLQYIFQIPQTTISRIIPEVLDAIYKVLVKKYLKVSACGAFVILSKSFCYFCV